MALSPGQRMEIERVLRQADPLQDEIARRTERVAIGADIAKAIVDGRSAGMDETTTATDTASAGNPLVVRGLAERVAAARKGLAAARAAASGLDDSSRAFCRAAEEIKQQIDAAREDLIFEATMLGNSGN